MTDTAEYWADVKRESRPNDFYHAKGVDCGHRHNCETPYVQDVECKACLAKIKSFIPVTMREGKAPETFYMSAKMKKVYNARKKFNEQHGICSCGCEWTIRKNRKDGSSFLGCSNYPRCKKTKAISLS